ncbi:hypothetical protein NC652_002623 [Populus alba x Populus x berolinensis]|uniref:Uncharacterized protein n=1 Tax=Populus alba x Populus x berolinensis TaxID=444605 RepID=A0AAD6WJG8_9ROSI|nr:hypothetical protein NC652_002623 [Populus alba x Populus x berolinensis]KAJ7012729.1 hypothetical protein NC653_002697 [Populus alba x Populus x berolinensis]
MKLQVCNTRAHGIRSSHLHMLSCIGWDLD